jgi:hypothetical protein
MLACALIGAHPALARVTTAPMAAPSTELSAVERAEILDRLTAAMDGYVDPTAVGRLLPARQPPYTAIGDRNLLARTLSTDLIATSIDLHLNVAVVTNWNGRGVEPVVAVPSADALTKAYRRALAVATPTVVTPKSFEEREKAIADPRAALVADQPL